MYVLKEGRLWDPRIENENCKEFLGTKKGGGLHWQGGRWGGTGLRLETPIAERGLAEGSFPVILFRLANTVPGRSSWSWHHGRRGNSRNSTRGWSHSIGVGSHLMVWSAPCRKDLIPHPSMVAFSCILETQDQGAWVTCRYSAQTFHPTSGSWVNCLKPREKINSWGGGIGRFPEGHGHTRQGKHSKRKESWDYNPEVITYKLRDFPKCSHTLIHPWMVDGGNRVVREVTEK